MRKNKLILILSVLVMLTLLMACSKDSNSEASSESSDSYEISYSTWANEGEPAYQGMEKFKEIVEDETNGDVSVELYPANQLGTTEEQQEQVKLGTLEMMSSGNPGIKEIEYLSLPYLMNSNKNWNHVLESDIGEKWNEKLINEMGMRNIATLPRGPRVISANEEIHTPEDMEGLKIRSPERDYYVQTFEALNASPTPMDFGELYSGLQSGVVDAQENPLETFYSAGFAEVQDYIILSKHMYKPAFVTINNEFLNDLPDDYQQIILDAAKESETYATEKLNESAKKMTEELKDEGITFIEPDVEAFKEATQKVRDELGVDMWGEETYQKIVEMGKKDLD